MYIYNQSQAQLSAGNSNLATMALNFEHELALAKLIDVQLDICKGKQALQAEI